MVRMRELFRLPAVILIVALALTTGCFTPRPVYVTRRATVSGPLAGFEQRGTASYYGEGFHGRLTASGEVYDMYAMTCAHKMLPFGTVLRVRNLDNGRETTVTVNDRGPYVAGRIVDLSVRAAEELDMIESGIASVIITVIGVEADDD
jgi:rare lipoprotein A